jgi:hypothetical protein
MNPSHSISIDEILQRLSVSLNSRLWSILIVQEEDSIAVISELEESIPLFIDDSIEIITADCEVEEIIHQLHYSINSHILIHDFSGWAILKWKQFDYLRNSFAPNKGGIFLLTAQEVGLFQLHAPNFASWIGSRVYHIQFNSEVLTGNECEERLQTLREQTGKSDSQIIQLAEDDKLSLDPEYGEWLILLGRGDLIGR